MTEQRKKRLKRQIQESRYRLNKLNKDFAAPLKEMLYVATKDVKRISTNGFCIYFDPDWLQKLNNTELDFILSHQLMHIALGHIDRPKYYSGDRFHLACDIIANSNLEVFGFEYDKLPHIGKIFSTTFFPAQEGRLLTVQEALKGVPFDPAAMEPAIRRRYMIDSETWWNKKEDRGENGVIILSPDDADPEGLIDDTATAGYNHFIIRKEEFEEEKDVIKTNKDGTFSRPQLDWDKSALDEIQSLREALERNLETQANENFTERVWQRVNSGNLNWKKLLNRFIQEEVCDYSFTPPDRRFQDTGFFLPDYNVLVEKPKEIFFMVDTSGSVNDDMLSAVYSEICNALLQFNGGLVGMLGFFDMRVYTPVSFSTISDLLRIKPVGHGGTNFNCIFDYVQSNLPDNAPVDIVIFTR